MKLLPVYRERCNKCNSKNTRSYSDYDTHEITIVCKKCGNRQPKAGKK